MAESPEEKEALAKLDEVTREVSAEEFQKEADREVNTFWGGGPSRRLGWMFGRFRPFRRATWRNPVPEPLDDDDPVGGPSMHDVMHGAHVDDAEDQKS